MPSSYAPIIVFPYNRPMHLKSVIYHLSKNTLANKSEIYLFCDGPHSKQDKKNVMTVRALCREITGFKTINIIEREENLGCYKNIRFGIDEILSSYDSAIIVDDDVITSPYFLNFMNQALIRYKNEPCVFSISGWCPPSRLFKIPPQYSYDSFFMYRNGSWGWGIWTDRWNKIDYDLKNITNFLKDTSLCLEFCKGGEDLLNMLKDQIHGMINTWDIQLCYSQFKHGCVSLYPTISYTTNIGTDGTGFHFSKKTEKWDNNILSTIEDCKFPDHIVVDRNIQKSFSKIYSHSSFFNRIFDRIFKNNKAY